MNWSKIPAGLVNAAEQRLLVALGDDADVVIERLNSDPAYVSRMATNMVLSARPNSKLTAILNSQWLRAREIMGRNFFGLEEAMQIFGVNPTRQDLDALLEIPFSEETLIHCRDTHVLAAVFPISIIEIRSRATHTQLFSEKEWYNREPFAQEHGKTNWQLVRKTAVENSFRMDWQDQQSLVVNAGNEVPTAQVMVYTIIGHYFATGEHLFENVYVRVSSVGPDGSNIMLGHFSGTAGLDIQEYWNNSRQDYIGVASARKIMNTSPAKTPVETK